LQTLSGSGRVSLFLTDLFDMRVWRFLALWVSIGLITFGTVSTAAAKPATRDVAGHIVLCTGHGPTTILIGSDGQPIDPDPMCPECVVSLAHIGASMFSIAPCYVTLSDATFVDCTDTAVGRDAIDPLARGPPQLL
jgi:hypothetical protein